MVGRWLSFVLCHIEFWIFRIIIIHETISSDLSKDEGCCNHEFLVISLDDRFDGAGHTTGNAVPIYQSIVGRWTPCALRILWYLGRRVTAGLRGGLC